MFRSNSLICRYIVLLYITPSDRNSRLLFPVFLVKDYWSHENFEKTSVKGRSMGLTKSLKIHMINYHLFNNFCLFVCNRTFWFFISLVRVEISSRFCYNSLESKRCKISKLKTIWLNYQYEVFLKGRRDKSNRVLSYTPGKNCHTFYQLTKRNQYWASIRIMTQL